MNELSFFTALLWASFGLAVITATYLMFFTAPYGRHARAGYGPSVSNVFGWVLMEAPAALVPLLLVWLGERHDVVTLLMVAIWEAHYVQRAFVYPALIRGRGARMPLFVALSGATFNVLNGYLNFRFLTHFGPGYASSWLTDPRFVAGVALFATGYLVNRHADRVLRSLRAPGETGYKIPRGGLYRFISCPNYFGELIEWCGWAVLTWSLPGLFFALFTAANLVPRARAHHRDYLRRFADYPPERRAVIPFLF